MPSASMEPLTRGNRHGDNSASSTRSYRPARRKVIRQFHIDPNIGWVRNSQSRGPAEDLDHVYAFVWDTESTNRLTSSLKTICDAKTSWERGKLMVELIMI